VHLAHNQPATPQIFTLSLHDALPIFCSQKIPVGHGCLPLCLALSALLAHAGHEGGDGVFVRKPSVSGTCTAPATDGLSTNTPSRSEVHTSELQSLTNLVCRLLLQKKN